MPTLQGYLSSCAILHTHNSVNSRECHGTLRLKPASGKYGKTESSGMPHSTITAFRVFEVADWKLIKLELKLVSRMTGDD
mgnify:CR=1 FL=1